MNAQQMLIAIFNSEKMVEVEFKPEWHNGTGYFNAVCTEDLGLEVGTCFRFIAGGEDKRHAVGVVTPVGNLVFFERYTGSDEGVVVMNYPHKLAGLYPSGMVSAETLDQAMGGIYSYSTNIGVVLGRVAGCVPTPKFVLTDDLGARGVAVTVIDDTSSDVVLYDSLASKRDFPRPEEVTSFAVPFERVRQLTARLPGSEHNTRRVAAALDMYVSADIANAIPRLDELFAKFEGMSEEEVAAWISDTIVGHAKELLDISRHGRTHQAGVVEVRHEVRNPPVDDESK